MSQAFRKRITTTGLAALLCGLWAGAAGAQTTHPLFECATLVTSALRDYTVDVVHRLALCEKKRREKPVNQAPADCRTDQDTLTALESYDEEFSRAVDGCYPADKPIEQQPGRALCPLESRRLEVLLNYVTSIDPDDDTDSVKEQLMDRVADLFVTPFEGCPRPVLPIVNDNPLRNCASEIARLAEEKGDELDQCFFSCEKNNLSSSDACADENDGEPNDDDVAACVGSKSDPEGGDGLRGIADTCTDAHIAALGCPLGEITVAGFTEAFAGRLVDFAQTLNVGTFHSSCRTSLAGAPIIVEPADVTLAPSLRKAKVSCGQVLDATFFGTDKILRFDTDLNCVAVETATDGIVVDKSGVTIDGRGKTRSISGPGSRRLRTGAGIKIAPGASRVKITGFRRIQNFGYGVLDSGDNKVLKVNKSTFFRNLQAGVRSSSKKTIVVDSTFDRNGIGVHLTGDDSEVKNKLFVRRSEPQQPDALTPLSPGYGILVGGNDVNGNGRTVRVHNTTLDENRVGIVVEGSQHIVSRNKIEQSTEAPPADVRDGIRVMGFWNDVIGNSVKFHTGSCIVVMGDENLLDTNRCEDNAGVGFDVAGLGNVLQGNNAGAPGHGNGLAGFLLSGTEAELDSNRAEGNLGDGYVLQGTTVLFKGNRAEGNAGMGFAVHSSGNGLETNSASANGSFEFDIAAGNVDLTGNKKNGSGFSFGPGAQTFE